MGEKLLPFIIMMDSQDACLMLPRKSFKSLFYHKFWAWIQLTDFWHNDWICKGTQVYSSTVRKALQSLFLHFFIAQCKLMYLIAHCSSQQVCTSRLCKPQYCTLQVTASTSFAPQRGHTKHKQHICLDRDPSLVYGNKPIPYSAFSVHVISITLLLIQILLRTSSFPFHADPTNIIS